MRILLVAGLLVSAVFTLATVEVPGRGASTGEGVAAGHSSGSGTFDVSGWWPFSQGASSQGVSKPVEGAKSAVSRSIVQGEPVVASWTRSAPSPVRRARSAPVEVRPARTGRSGVPKPLSGSSGSVAQVEVQAVEVGEVSPRSTRAQAVVEISPHRSRVSRAGRGEQIAVVEVGSRERALIDSVSQVPLKSSATPSVLGAPERAPEIVTRDAEAEAAAIEEPPVDVRPQRRNRTKTLRRRTKVRRAVQRRRARIRASRAKRKSRARRASARKSARSRYRTRRRRIGSRGLVRVKRKCFRKQGCYTVVRYRRPRNRSEARELSRIRNRIVAQQIRRSRRRR